jgi:hypothetical protein
MPRKVIPFNDLSPRARERLLTALNQESEAAFLVYQPLRTPLPIWALIGLVFAGGMSLQWLWSSDYGVPLGAQALTSPADLPWYLLAACAVAMPVLLWAAHHVRQRQLPYTPGVYLLPRHLVDARGDVLTLHRVPEDAELGVTRREKKLAVRLPLDDGDSFELLVPDTLENRKALGRFRSTLRAVRYAREQGERAWLTAISPFSESRSSARGTETPLTRPMHPLLKQPYSIGGTLGVGVGAALLFLRVLGGDAAVVEAIHAEPSSERWSWYIDAGGRRAAEASATWLPEAIRQEDEAAFAEGLRVDTSVYWRKYLKEFTIHAEEVQLERLPEAALKEALAASSVNELRRFLQDFSGEEYEGFQARATEAIDGYYAAAGAAFQEQAAVGNAQLVWAFQQLLSWLKENDTTEVGVVFQSPDITGIEAADTFFNGYATAFGCSGYMPAGYKVKGLSLDYAEERITKLLGSGFSKVASADLLQLRHASAADDSAPGFRVKYTISPLQDAQGYVPYVLESTNACYQGIRVQFLVELSIPGNPYGYSFWVTAEPPERFSIEQLRRFSGLSMDPTNVYSRMVSLAFNNLAEALQTRLFRAESDAGVSIQEMLDTWGAQQPTTTTQSY